MQAVYIAALVIVVSAVAALLVALAMRRTVTNISLDRELERSRQLEGEIGLLRDARADLERRLAVEHERSSRLSDLDTSLGALTESASALRDDKSNAERLLAAATEARAQIEATLSETRERLTSAEHEVTQVLSRLNDLAQEKGKLEQAVAGKIEVVVQMEANLLEVRGRLASAEEARDQHRAELNDLRTTLATIQESLEQERKQSDEKLALVNDTKDRMTQEFKLLANGVIRQHSEDFKKQNREQIDNLLNPLKVKLTEFQQGLQNSHHESSKERAALSQQIRQLTETSAKMTLVTTNLTLALKGSAPIRGVWGEMVLTSILERSGLREGEEYDCQLSHTTEDGQRLRPDVIVNLPGGQRIIIDSKVSLIAFEAYVNAATEEGRTLELARHVGSIRGHIKALGGKEYQALSTSALDYVVMFIPIEDALSVALREDGNLSIYATENNVAIATPTTLMIALRTAANVWHVERRNRNAEQIAEHAGRVFGKFVGFVEDLKGLGTRLTQARDSYDGAMNKLSSGRGNLVQQIEYLKEMGAKTTKSLPKGLLDDATADELVPIVEYVALPLRHRITRSSA